MADKKCEYYKEEDYYESEGDYCLLKDLYTRCHCKDKHKCRIWQEEDKQEQKRREWRKKFFES